MGVGYYFYPPRRGGRAGATILVLPGDYHMQYIYITDRGVKEIYKERKTATLSHTEIYILLIPKFYFNPQPNFSIFQILQNLGKADKTTDEIFEEHLQNFNNQQVNATRLHKDINNYLRCIKGQLEKIYVILICIGINIMLKIVFDNLPLSASVN